MSAAAGGGKKTALADLKDAAKEDGLSGGSGGGLSGKKREFEGLNGM